MSRAVSSSSRAVSSPRRFHRVVCAALAAGALALAGCESTGLSAREVRGRDYATYAYSMYDPSSLTDSPASAEPAKPIATPAKIAVAQLGEVAPPADMIDRLRKNSAVFASVQPVSGVLNTDPADARAHAQDYS